MTSLSDSDAHSDAAGDPVSTDKSAAAVTMYSTAVCPYCVRAEALLRQRGVTDIHKIRVDLDAEQRTQMMTRTKRRTVPQIFIGDTYVGGFDDLAALDRQGQLTALLNGRS